MKLLTSFMLAAVIINFSFTASATTTTINAVSSIYKSASFTTSNGESDDLPNLNPTIDSKVMSIVMDSAVKNICFIDPNGNPICNLAITPALRMAKNISVNLAPTNACPYVAFVN